MRLAAEVNEALDFLVTMIDVGEPGMRQIPQRSSIGPITDDVSGAEARAIPVSRSDRFLPLDHPDERRLTGAVRRGSDCVAPPSVPPAPHTDTLRPRIREKALLPGQTR